MLPTHIAALLLPLLAPSDSSTNQWTQWRGPARDGAVPGSSWSADLTDEHFAAAWSAKDLGPSYSGPVADEARVYTTETENEEYEVVRAFDRRTGEQVWSTRWKGSLKVPFFAARNGSWIRSTPALDGDSLYVAGMRDMLKCIDTATGKERWSVDITERFETEPQPFGFVCSPLVHGDALFVQTSAALLKLNKATGETLWRSLDGETNIMNAGAFSSPVVRTLRGVEQLVVQTRSELAGVDLASGEVLWSTPIKAFRGMNILTPLVVGNDIFTTTYGGRARLLTVNKNEDGLAVTSVWDTPAQGYMSSPVVLDGYAYVFLKSNRFSCIDLASGETLWTSPPTGDDYWSLVLQGDRILALADTGMLRLISANPTEYMVLSERRVTESESWAHVAPAGDQVFVRTQDGLLAFNWRDVQAD